MFLRFTLCTKNVLKPYLKTKIYGHILKLVMNQSANSMDTLEIDVSTGATTATLPLKAIDISQDPENSDVASANTNVMVVINNHLLSAGTTGLA